MNNYKLQEIDKNTILLLPIDYQIPLSVIIEDFNMKNEKLNGTVLMDLFIYVANKKNRYKSFRIKNGQIYLNYSEVYHPDTKIVDAFYNLFAEAPIGMIERIVSPAIKKLILEKHLIKKKVLLEK